MVEDQYGMIPNFFVGRCVFSINGNRKSACVKLLVKIRRGCDVCGGDVLDGDSGCMSGCMVL